MDPVGDSQTVTVTVTTNSFYPTVNTETRVKSKDFTLTFKNPCFDTDFVEIVAPTLLDYTYIVYDTPKTKTHPVFTVKYSPEDHLLCGVLSYSAKFEDSSVGTTDKPFAYFDNQQIVLESDEKDLIGEEKDYKVTAEFSLFPQSDNP